MHIIIVGAGEVGRYLAEILSAERQDVYLIERDERLARELDEKLDASVIHGTGISRAALLKAGINRADLLLAVTQTDEVNLVAAMTAERLNPACRTVARVREPRLRRGTDAIDAEEYGVDLLLGPEQAVSEQIVRLLQYAGPGRMSSLAGDRVALLELPVSPHSALAYATLAELQPELPSHADVIAAIGKTGLRLTDPESRFEVGERVLFLTVPGEVNAILDLAGSDSYHVKRVLLIGGGEIGYQAARALQDLKFDVTVFEKDIQRAEEIAVKLSKSVVIQGDGSDPAALTEQINEGQEAVVVLLEDDLHSLLTAVMAKHVGGKKVIARVDNPSYGPISRKLGVDAMISPRRAVADEILRFIRRSRIASTTIIGDHEGELIEFDIAEKAKRKLTEPTVSAVKMPDGARIAAIVRGNDVIIPAREKHETHIAASDHVLVIALRRSVSKLEELF
jgi:trk system potassium uptake protein TrkA